jgi:endo-1,4-beta-D-glucanase Y
MLALAILKNHNRAYVGGGCDLTDIQFILRHFFRLFAEASGDNDWNKLADDTYTILNASAHPKTGLVPDWQSVTGTPGGNSDRVPFFRYDACRVPWRISIDYLWNGNTKAKQWCTKVSDWHMVSSCHIKRINLDGSENSQGFIKRLTGGLPWLYCNNQAVADAIRTEMRH